MMGFMEELMEESAMVYESHDAGRLCPCVSRHVPVVNHVIRHHIWPKGSGGPDTEDNLIWLCPTTHENTHTCERLYRQYEGHPPWDRLLSFSLLSRDLGRRAYRSSVEQRIVP